MPRPLTRWKKVILDEISQVDGLMRLLMKNRNGAPWNVTEKEALTGHLRALAQGIPFLIVFSLPGGMFLLPLLACFLDRRKDKLRSKTLVPTPFPESAHPEKPIE
jgi:hypothetical protein